LRGASDPCRLLVLLATDTVSAFFKLTDISHLSNNSLYVTQINNFFAPRLYMFATHFRNTVFDILQYFFTLGCIPEMLFNINHIRPYGIVSILLDMEHDAVNIYDNCLVHNLV